MRARVSALFLSLLFSASLFAQDHAARIRAFEAFVEREMKAQKMTGLSVAVKHGELSWSRGFGYADVENAVPAKPESSYRTASVAKPMTAVAILKLAQEGKLDLDADVQTYVPYFPKKSHPVTSRLLLSHLGGISHYRDYVREGRIREPKNTREALEIFAGFDLVAEPGTRYQYSSYGYNLLGAVIEGASGRTYGDYLREHVWKPLAMHDTRMDDPRAIIPNRVTGYVLQNGELRRSDYVDISSRFGGGGARSTVLDLVRFMEGLADGKVLTSEMRDRAWTMAETRDGRTIHYGYGFSLYSRNGRYVIAHSGSQQETRTLMSYIPSGELYIAIASNFEDANLGRFEDELIELLLGDPAPIRMRGSTRQDDLALAAIHGVFEHGLAWYTRHGRPMTTDPRELDQAFRYFRASLTDGAKIEEGEHRASNYAYAKLGSHMAAALARENDLDLYHREGALRFVRDFARLRERRLDRPFARRVQEWLDAWNALPPSVRKLDLGAPDALAQLETLADAPVKPDYSASLVRRGEQAALRGDVLTAGRIGTLAVQVYPGSPSAHGFLGVLTLMGGDRGEAMARLRTSLELDPTGYASARNLANIASAVPESIAAVLRAASKELHGE